MTSDVSGCPPYWSGGSGAVLICSGSNGHGGILAVDGNQLLGLQSNGASVLQSLLLGPGALYTLSFYAAAGARGSASIVVYIGPTVVLTTAAPPIMTMTYYSVRLIADASSQSVSFTINVNIAHPGDRLQCLHRPLHRLHRWLLHYHRHYHPLRDHR